ncbi:histidine kinase [Brachybacterium phenoliresistens]|uniref:histidine kinase n=1 Tax=Brachybacterium phenoliresistens TaxID=396014 RepID=Z9JT30_9MICO|nr:histidine kinase [Brachybacterium phenoliresistens]EWS81359.1 histidine kinase [Brachybacterium phenoliresistens]
MSELPPPDAQAAEALRRGLPLRRSVTATWWYVAGGVVFFELMVVLLSTAELAAREARPAAVLGLSACGLAWVAAGLIPLADYRHRSASTPLLRWPRSALPLAASLLFGAALGLTTGSWTLAAMPLLQMLVLLNWPAGVRLRVVLAVTVLLIALAAIDTRQAIADQVADRWYQMVSLVVILPPVSVSSLWWWDVVVRLDRARASEAKLAATQERLHLATDVHDLQGHHLQVIALQLELAERLMPRDPEAGMAQLRAARGSVDEARQGTRDLAARFRSVPLGDEVANAADLLRAAGARIESDVHAEASLAPADVLGPVIRETTTNALRHGGGRWARLALAREAGTWRYEIANDLVADAPADPADGVIDRGTGLEGIGRRVAEAGGTLAVRRDGGAFTVTVTVPDVAGEGR